VVGLVCQFVLFRLEYDEQRIDNCNVPPDKRGTKPRPSVCPHVPMG